MSININLYRNAGLGNRLDGAYPLGDGSSGGGWTIDRSFNAGPVGNTVEGQADGFDESAFGSIYSNEQNNGDGLVAKVQVRNGNTDFGYWGGIVDFTENVGKGGEFWASFNYYVPTSYQITTDNNVLKFVRIRQQTQGGGNTGYLECDMVTDNASLPWSNHSFTLMKEGWSTLRGVGGPSEIPRDTWFNVELYAKLNDENAPSSPTPGTGDGIFRLWIDGALVGEEDMRTLAAATDVATGFYLGTYWNGGAPQDQATYIDRLKITTVQPTNQDASGNYIIGQTA